jgi:hypothetical protein
MAVLRYSAYARDLGNWVTNALANYNGFWPVATVAGTGKPTQSRQWGGNVECPLREYKLPFSLTRMILYLPKIKAYLSG